MAEINLTADALSLAHAGRRGSFIREVTIDFAKNNAEASDVVQAIPVKAGERVDHVVVEVLTAEGGVATANVGDGSDADGYLAAVNLNAVGLTDMALTLTDGTPNTVAGYTNGKLYAADDTIDLVPGANVDNAVVRVMALITDYRA